MKQALVIRHVTFEDLGSFARPLADMGFSIDYHAAGAEALDLEAASAADLLVVLGGPIGVYQIDEYPFLEHEIEAVRRRLAVDAPTLGICLGAQIMAAALGAAVYPGSAGKEIGWSALDLTAAGNRSALAGLEGIPVLHWHGDTFDLPEAATLLASTPRYANQAFSVGRRALALQFHPEVELAGLEQWLVGHSVEIASAGLRVSELRLDNRRNAPGLTGAGSKLLNNWLSSVST